MLINRRSGQAKGLIFATITAFCWGFLAIAIKVSLNEVPTKTVVWFRFFSAFVILLVYFIIKNPRQIRIIAHPPLLSLITAFSLGMNYLGFIEGINHTSPNNAQVFIQLGPLLLAVSGFVIYKERLSYRQLFGFGLAIAGFSFFYRDQLNNLLDSSVIYNKGILWVIFGALSWSVFAIIQKKLVQSYNTQQLNLINFGLPVLMFIPFVDFNVLFNLNAGGWLLLLFLGVNTFVAYSCLAIALKYAEANKVSIIITLNPIITFIVMALLGFLEVTWIKEEVYTFFTVIGALMVIGGAITVALFSKKGKNRNNA